MDLNTITDIVERPDRAAAATWTSGDGWLAGGTWLFSEPQPHLRRLHDLHGFGWPALEVDDGGLTIAATCRIAELERWSPPPAWRAASALVGPCCRALLGSFKVWNAATVGGNVCLALPAAPMIALAAALEGTCLLWSDTAERTLPILDFVLDAQRTALRPGEILRSVRLGADALRRLALVRQISLTPLGRSAALLIGTRASDGAFALTVTASTRRPVRLAFQVLPHREALRAALADLPADLTFDDVHGAPAWRRHVTAHLADEVLDALAGRDDGPWPPAP